MMPHYVALSSVKNRCDAFFYMNWKGGNYLGEKKIDALLENSQLWFIQSDLKLLCKSFRSNNLDFII